MPKSYAVHFRETLALSYPVIIGQLGTVLMGVVDNAMVGQVSYVHLSAGTLANNVFFIVAVIGIGLTSAISALVAEAAGQKDTALAGDYLRQGVWAGTGISLIITLLVLGAAELLPYLDQPVEDVKLATPYLRIIATSTLPMVLFLVYKNFSDGLGHTRVAMYITLAGLLSNVFFNWLWIFGHWGFPRLELDGAGYGTLAARLVMMVLIVLYVRRSALFRAYDPRMRWREYKSRVIKRILSIGLPSGGQYFFEIGAFAGATILIGLLPDGNIARAGHQIALSAASVAFMIVTGISSGASIRVGNAMGANAWPDLRRAGWAGVALGVGFMAFSAVMFLLFSREISLMYLGNNVEGNNAAVLAIAETLFVYAAAFALFDGAQAVGIGILRGLQDVKIPTVVTFVAYWAISLPLGYGLMFTLGMGVVGVWWSFIAGLGFAAVAHSLRFWWLTRGH